jgi:amino acid permease
LGSIAIAVNSLAGPAILQLPYQYQQSGIIPTTLCLISVAILSAFCSLHMANTVSKIPGNQKFDQCIEFSDAFRIFWSDRAYMMTQILFYLTATCLNIAAIVDTAQTVDSFLGFHWKSYGVSLDSSSQGHHFEEWSHDGPCTRRQVKLGKECAPFGDQTVNFLLTAGYVLTALVFLPICLRDLKENTVWQIFGFGLLLSLSMYFCLDLSQYHLSLKHVSLWGHQWTDMMGVILFNFCLVLAIPAWLHEKRESVSVRHTIIVSTVISTALYISVGIIGALAIPNINLDMLSPMLSGAFGEGIQVAASLFAFFIIGLDIPLFSVLTRYNLTHSGMCSVRMANILVVWIPWGISWVFYTGNDIGVLLAWGGVLLTSAVAFLLPLYLARRALAAQPAHEFSGSVGVYGDLPWLRSREAQMNALSVLLAVAAVSVAAAIGGQLVMQEHQYEVTHSLPYLNSSTVEELKAGVGVVTAQFLRKVGLLAP